MLNKFIACSLITCGIFLAGCDQNAQIAEKPKETFSNPCPMDQNAGIQTEAPKSGDQIAVLKTNKGDIKIKLFPDLVPETVKNFEELAKEGKYDGTIFHRVIENFMIQGGDFETGRGYGGYSYKGPNTTIDDEFNDNLKNICGALSMANSGPNTNGSQFFIVHAPKTEWLDGVHSVFGQVYEGMEVVDEIAKAEADLSDKPLEDIVLETVEISTY